MEQTRHSGGGLENSDAAVVVFEKQSRHGGFFIGATECFYGPGLGADPSSYRKFEKKKIRCVPSNFWDVTGGCVYPRGVCKRGHLGSMMRLEGSAVGCLCANGFDRQSLNS